MAGRDCARCHTDFVLIVPGLELCDCSSRGHLSYLKGAEADARRLVESQGGLAALRDRLAAAKEARRKKQQQS